jgi:hypothetical protein
MFFLTEYTMYQKKEERRKSLIISSLFREKWYHRATVQARCQSVIAWKSFVFGGKK